MQLFSDQILRPHPHIVVCSSHKIGNFVVTTPLLRGLKEKYPDCTLDFLGSNLTQSFEKHCQYIDWRISLPNSATDLSDLFRQHLLHRIQEAGPYDLFISCDEYGNLAPTLIELLQPKYLVGGATDPQLRKQYDYVNHPLQRILLSNQWNDTDFLEKFPDVAENAYIAELFCRLAYVETDFFKLELPSKSPKFLVPDVLIHVTAARPAKMWVPTYWRWVINWCTVQGYSVGLVGSRPAQQKTLYHAAQIEDDLLEVTSVIDLRGKTTLPELAGALASARAFICVDTGPLHIAAAMNCPTVAIFGNHQAGQGASPMNLWAPRVDTVKIVHSLAQCDKCHQAQFKNANCLLSYHDCMLTVLPEAVIRALITCLSPKTKADNEHRQKAYVNQ